MAITIEECNSCKFFKTDTYQCRRYPPVSVVAHTTNALRSDAPHSPKPSESYVYEARQPKVQSGFGWCGEWKKR